MKSELLIFAPEGQIWVCAACGKTAKDLYGMEGRHSRGWDVSCLMNSVLCYEQKDANGNWVAVPEHGPENAEG